ncbi:MAG: cytidylyltransferase domain-containing protein [bacterium]
MTRKKVTALILARMTSSRLPGKGLMDLAGHPLLWHIVQRLGRVPSLTEMALATTAQPEDQPLADFARMVNIEAFTYAGEVDDVIGRIVAAADFFASDVVVTISGDCPLVDPAFIELVIRTLIASRKETVVVDQRKVKCMHEGISVMTRTAWHKLEAVSNEPYQREHAGIYLKEHPEFLQCAEVVPEKLFQRNTPRISVDNLADLRFMRTIYERLYRPGEIVDLKEVVQLLDQEPEIRKINAHVAQKHILQRSRRVAFLCEAGAAIGMGHLRRCLALATELHERHHCGVLLVTNHHQKTIRWLTSRGFNCQTIKGNLFEKINRNKLVSILTTFKAEALVIDLKREIPDQVIQSLQENGIATVVLDNLSAGSKFADLVVLPVAHVTNEAPLVACRGKVLHGAPYVLLNHEFLNVPAARAEPDSRLPQVLVSMGGSDPNKLTERVVEALAGLEFELAATVVLGPYYDEGRPFDHYQNLRVLKDVANMAELLSNANLAILAFGVTLYEAVYLGIPSLVIAHSQHDAECTASLATMGLCASLGFWREVTVQRIQNEVSALLNKAELRTTMSRTARTSIDGHGVSRVAKEVMLTLAGPGRG